MKQFLIILCAWWPLVAGAADALRPEDAAFFEGKIRPLLESRCFECHSHQSGKMKGGLTLDSQSGWMTGGDQGPVIVPGNLEKSRLIVAVRHGDPDLKMPPKQKLPDEEIALLEEWVKRGAPDPRTTPVATTGEWWSLKPMARPKAPEGSGNPIDAFIEARLRQAGLQTSSEADRRTLIRRLTFDLHGLMPSPEEVEAFVADARQNAYEALVDRLLASPRYGERWARHWLDTIHFADTHGFEHDLMRTNAWRYRDYVIESLNRDTPWPRFIREQLAADAFFPEEPRLAVALGFIGAGPWDHSTAQTAPITSLNLDRDDMVTQTMTAFASSTVNCARCHDHKFDPITLEDYYSMQAVFAGVGKGDLPYDEDPKRARERRRWQGLMEAAETQNKAVLLAAESAELVRQWEEGEGGEVSWETLALTVFTTAGNALLKRQADGSFLAEGARPDTDTYTLVSTPNLREITAVRLEVLADAALPKKGPGRQENNGNLHLSEFVAQVFLPGAAQREKAPIRRATADFNQDGWTISHAIDGNEKTAWGIHPREGESHTAVFEFENKLSLTNGAQLVLQLKQLHGDGHLIGKFRLAVTGDPAQRASVLPAELVEARRVPAGERTEAQRLLVATHALRATAEERLAAMPPALRAFGAGPRFIAVAEGSFHKAWREPKVVQVLKRGDIEKPIKPASPGAIAAIGELPGRFALSNPNDEASRRVAMAEWLADARNPLTWRSAVNRVWHHHFGRGIADTLNDFGRMGSPPSHPELLEWLACEFRDSGGTLKPLHRMIVTSAAYRRGAGRDQAALAKDPDNILLWCRQSRRLDAETYRDTVLAITGRLDLTMGGPGAQQFKLGKPIQLTPTVDYTSFDWDSPAATRRSIYRFVYRGLQDPFLEALDFPDAAQLAPVRSFSSSALQALVLLNNDFVLHQSTRFAERLEKMDAELAGRVRQAFRLALQREPNAGEAADFAAFANQRGLPAMCRVLLNSNEFLFVN